MLLQCTRHVITHLLLVHVLQKYSQQRVTNPILSFNFCRWPETRQTLSIFLFILSKNPFFQEKKYDHVVILYLQLFLLVPSITTLAFGRRIKAVSLPVLVCAGYVDESHESWCS